MSFPEDSSVEVRYPLTSEQEHGDREAWPWLPGWVVSECGPDEWEICVQAPNSPSRTRTAKPTARVLPGRLRAPPAGRGTGGRAVNRLGELSAAEIEAEDALRAVAPSPKCSARLSGCEGARALGAAHAELQAARNEPGRGRAMTADTATAGPAVPGLGSAPAPAGPAGLLAGPGPRGPALGRPALHPRARTGRVAVTEAER